MGINMAIGRRAFLKTVAMGLAASVLPRIVMGEDLPEPALTTSTAFRRERNRIESVKDWLKLQLHI